MPKQWFLCKWEGEKLFDKDLVKFMNDHELLPGEVVIIRETLGKVRGDLTFMYYAKIKLTD